MSKLGDKLGKGERGVDFRTRIYGTILGEQKKKEEMLRKVELLKKFKERSMKNE